MKRESRYKIMLGMFAKNTPEYANKRKNEAAELIDEVNITEGDYLVVVAGPFNKADAEANLAKLTESGMEGYIYKDSENNEKETPEEPVD